MTRSSDSTQINPCAFSACNVELHPRAHAPSKTVGNQHFQLLSQSIKDLRSTNLCHKRTMLMYWRLMLMYQCIIVPPFFQFNKMNLFRVTRLRHIQEMVLASLTCLLRLYNLYVPCCTTFNLPVELNSTEILMDIGPQFVHCIQALLTTIGLATSAWDFKRSLPMSPRNLLS